MCVWIIELDRSQKGRKKEFFSGSKGRGERELGR